MHCPSHEETVKVKIQGRADERCCMPMRMVVLTRASNIYETEIGKKQL
jgi:hypothetical protein